MRTTATQQATATPATPPLQDEERPPRKLAIKYDGTNAVAILANLVDVPNGDTLEISSTDGTFRIVFEPWPFAEPANAKKEVTESIPLTFQNKSTVADLKFEFYCYITPTGSNVEKGYPGADGGRGNVKP